MTDDEEDLARRMRIHRRSTEILRTMDENREELGTVTFLRIDHQRGVIYVDDARTGRTLLRICRLPTPIPKNVSSIDITNMVGVQYTTVSGEDGEFAIDLEFRGPVGVELCNVPDNLPPGKHEAKVLGLVERNGRYIVQYELAENEPGTPRST